MDTSWIQVLTIIGTVMSGFGWMIRRIDQKFDKVDEKFTEMDKKLANIETRVTVIESKIVDMNQNITRLMWQNQLPHKDSQEK